MENGIIRSIVLWVQLLNSESRHVYQAPTIWQALLKIMWIIIGHNSSTRDIVLSSCNEGKKYNSKSLNDLLKIKKLMNEKIKL